MAPDRAKAREARRAEAERILHTLGLTYRSVAEELGVHESTVSKWLRNKPPGATSLERLRGLARRQRTESVPGVTEPTPAGLVVSPEGGPTPGDQLVMVRRELDEFVLYLRQGEQDGVALSRVELGRWIERLRSHTAQRRR
jgi:transcriptional regulator with XRE-family HTH domain